MYRVMNAYRYGLVISNMNAHKRGLERDTSALRFRDIGDRGTVELWLECSRRVTRLGLGLDSIMRVSRQELECAMRVDKLGLECGMRVTRLVLG